MGKGSPGHYHRTRIYSPGLVSRALCGWDARQESHGDLRGRKIRFQDSGEPRRDQANAVYWTNAQPPRCSANRLSASVRARRQPYSAQAMRDISSEYPFLKATVQETRSSLPASVLATEQSDPSLELSGHVSDW